MNQDTNQPKSCTCAGGPFPAHGTEHFPYCALQENKCTCGAGGHDNIHLAHCAIRLPKADSKCTCTAKYNGGLHEPECAVTQADPLTAALHSNIKNLAARPLDVRMLIELERTCLLTREMLAIGKMPNAMSRRRMIHSTNVGYGDYGSDDGMATPIQVGGFGQFSAGQAMSSPNETFGVTAIRELVAGLAAINQPKESPIIKEMQETIARLEGQLKDAIKNSSEVEKPAIEAIGVAS